MTPTDESNTDARKPEPRKRKPLAFRSHDFEPRAWERDRIHRYSVRRPLWWRWWLKLREAGAQVGIR